MDEEVSSVQYGCAEDEFAAAAASAAAASSAVQEHNILQIDEFDKVDEFVVTTELDPENPTEIADVDDVSSAIIGSGHFEDDSMHEDALNLQIAEFDNADDDSVQEHAMDLQTAEFDRFDECGATMEPNQIADIVDAAIAIMGSGQGERIK